ncbi:GreA/GreB family elongation factor [Methylibium petroleiphilum]|uniref:Regulator of nucleoside diphosphate kinase n=1 Tax=Methylibium petroleiphilum (strain ATCC BAA-1232 / LMG 22953 / PM1) TaxID=420662 RepID=A2SHG3_METPP|nr:GreA/GreB family elongation factor [Methylibium petroleiphilum]ABM95002.1 regulator of nucleoside diphosphate kinase [Methylibium petroleiphilum PM1]
MEVLTLERTLTELDHVRLLSLARRQRPGVAAAAIEPLLDACTVVPSRQVRPDVVTMYSQVLLQDLASGLRSRLTLCYPADAEPAAGFVSVLSPVGCSLLGLTVGAVARWSTPSGEARSAEVVALLFQPEASGDYAM